MGGVGTCGNGGRGHSRLGRARGRRAAHLGGANTERPGMVRWTWVQLLEHLANYWRWIVLEQGFPLELSAAPLGELDALLSQRWKETPAFRSEEEGEDYEAFRVAHDLAEGLAGKVVESVLVVGEGHGFWVITQHHCRYIRGNLVIEVLESLGDHIARRLQTVDDARAKAVCQDWTDRLKLTGHDTVEIVTGWHGDELDSLVGNSGPVEFFEAAHVPPVDNPLMSAARMARGLGAETVRDVLAHLRTAPPVRSSRMDISSRVFRGRLQMMRGEKPYDQGYALAQLLRTELGVVSMTGRVDPGEILDAWGIPVTEFDLDCREIDAVACWGSGHGPAVFVNLQGEHARTAAGRRNTLAHEICHLLVDRDGLLPAAEVLGGRVSDRIEARAKSFAAELLLPREVAGRLMREAEAEGDLSVGMARLTSRYGVSQEVVAWQVRNSEVWVSAATCRYLRTKVSQPWRF